MRPTFTPEEMRALADTVPSPMQPHLYDSMRAALRYAADLIEAADVVIHEPS